MAQPFIVDPVSQPRPRDRRHPNINSAQSRFGFGERGIGNDLIGIAMHQQYRRAGRDLGGQLSGRGQRS